MGECIYVMVNHPSLFVTKLCFLFNNEIYIMIRLHQMKYILSIWDFYTAKNFLFFKSQLVSAIECKLSQKNKLSTALKNYQITIFPERGGGAIQPLFFGRGGKGKEHYTTSVLSEHANGMVAKYINQYIVIFIRFACLRFYRTPLVHKLLRSIRK